VICFPAEIPSFGIGRLQCLPLLEIISSEILGLWSKYIRSLRTPDPEFAEGLLVSHHPKITGDQI